MSKIFQFKINKNYNKVVIAFFVLAIIIVIFTVYFAFAKTIISVIPIPEKIDKELELPINDEEAQRAVTKLSNDYVYTVESTSEQREEGYATGKVTIINNYSANQPLINNTRLLSESGVLFRTQETVTVPQGGSVEVEVKADEPGEKGDIEPARFEIVALNASKKESIYAESTDKMTGGIIITTIATKDEIRRAKELAEDDLLEKAKEEFSKEIEKVLKKNIGVEILKIETDAQAGDLTSNITVSIEAEFYYVSLKKQLLLDSCQSFLEEQKGVGYDIVLNDKKNDIQYKIDRKYGKEIASVKCQGLATISSQSPLIKKNQLTNKTANQVQKYLESFASIQEVEVKFSPFWVKTTPFIKENIIIEVKNY